MKKIAIILSGCGVMDGAEIHESVLTMLAISQQNCSYDIYAPSINQAHVINHLKGEICNKQSRNVLEESARIARGDIKALSSLCINDYDILALPGGFGVAKNLSNFAFEGADCEVNKEVETAIKNMHLNNKPIIALCIAPIIVAASLGKGDLTIGNDKGTANAINSLGARHVESKIGEIVIDKENKLISTACYMLEPTLSELAYSISKAVDAAIKLC
ncbi:MAG: isoprenoid biosynthesis glyoxalase ElbB [Bacteroidales bacterium]